MVEYRRLRDNPRRVEESPGGRIGNGAVTLESSMRFGVLVVLSAAALALGMTLPDAMAAPAKQSSAKSKKSAKGSASTPNKSSKAAGKTAVAPPPAEPDEPALQLSDVQLVLATMVQTGQADCEFNQRVLVEPNERQLGGFRIQHGKATYTMVPEQTSTGTIRLVDEKSGVAWLQIRYKSMLMNTRAGQRMVDACSLPAQRMAEAEAVRMSRMAAENPQSAASAASDPNRELPLLKN